MRIGSLTAWQVLEDGESLKFPEARPGGIVVEVMAIAAEVTISDGLLAYPLGVINGYDRLEFRTDTPVELFVKGGAASYKTSELVELGQERIDGKEDVSFTEPFVQRHDAVDPAVKMMIARANSKARERESYLFDEIARLSNEVGRRAASDTAAAEQREARANPALSADGGEGKPDGDAGGNAGEQSASEPKGKPEGDAKSPVGKQSEA